MPLTTTKLAPMRGIADPPDRAAVAGVALQLAGEEGDPPALVGEVARARAARPASAAARSTVAQRAAEVVLAQFRVQRRDRLLPDERDDRVDQRQRAGEDQQRRRARAARARASATRPRRAQRRRAGAVGGDREARLTARLSSQSRLGTPERARAGVGQRPADRDLDALVRPPARAGSARRRAREHAAAAAAQPSATLQSSAEPKPDVPAGEQQHGLQATRPGPRPSWWA